MDDPVCDALHSGVAGVGDPDVLHGGHRTVGGFVGCAAVGLAFGRAGSKDIHPFQLPFFAEAGDGRSG